MTVTVSERQIIAALQGGLPLESAPFAGIAADLGLSEPDLLERLADMKQRGVIRRIAAAPNHYKLGMNANGMTVWDVTDAHITRLGKTIGALQFVTHCYERPRALPEWPFNLFAMVHGNSRAEVELKRQQIAAILGDDCQGSDILYSTRILKKTGLRLAAKG